MSIKTLSNFFLKSQHDQFFILCIQKHKILVYNFVQCFCLMTNLFMFYCTFDISHIVAPLKLFLPHMNFYYYVVFNDHYCS